MPKHDVFSPKAEANRQKSKGLQKLKWWCEMCHKQCRDENGFKNHQRSEGHLRQMAVYRENPQRLMEQFSREFEESFMEVLRRQGGRRVKANNVYQEVIANKEHVHMNATMWSTLSNFASYLGKTGKAVVEEAEDGLYVTYINRDQDMLERQARLAALLRDEPDAAERQRRLLQEQIERVREAEIKAKGEAALKDVASADPVRPEGAKISIALSRSSKSGASVLQSAAAPAPSPLAAEAPAPASALAPASVSASLPPPPKRAAVSALEELKAEIERKKRRVDPRAAAPSASAAPLGGSAAEPAHAVAVAPTPWLVPGIVVRVLNRDLLDGALYQQKATVQAVHDQGFTAQVVVAKTGHVLRIDQDELETVVPGIGKTVVIVRGPERGERGTVEGADVARAAVDVMLQSGQVLRGVPFASLCKVADD